MNKKQCKRCKEWYPSTAEYFYLRRNNSMGFGSYCIKCNREYKKEYYIKHKNRMNNLSKKYYHKNKISISNWSKKYRLENNEAIIKNKKEYYSKNRIDLLKKKKAYALKHKKQRKIWRQKYNKENFEILREKNRQYRKLHQKAINLYFVERKAKDVSFRVLHNLRNRLFKVLKFQNAKKFDHTLTLIGCSTKRLIEHIESQFDEKMSWDNYGKNGWWIDHIKPCASFDFADPEEQKRCFHYTNLQPLWGPDNLTKNSFYNGKYIRKRRSLCLR